MSSERLRAGYDIACSCTASPRTIYKGDHQKKSVTASSLASIMPSSSTSLRKDLSMLLIGLLLLCHITTVSARPHSTYTGEQKIPLTAIPQGCHWFEYPARIGGCKVVVGTVKGCHAVAIFELVALLRGGSEATQQLSLHKKISFLVVENRKLWGEK